MQFYCISLLQQVHNRGRFGECTAIIARQCMCTLCIIIMYAVVCMFFSIIAIFSVTSWFILVYPQGWFHSPITLHSLCTLKVSKPRKPSSQVTQKTLQSQSNTIKVLRDYVSREDETARSVWHFLSNSVVSSACLCAYIAFSIWRANLFIATIQHYWHIIIII